MASVRQHGTAAELVVRQLFREQELKFRKNAKGLPGSPDIVASSIRMAVFVHGCFWHRHARCRASTLPKTNTSFWNAKFADNQRRDQRNIRALKKLGYSVLVIWECQTKDAVKLARITRKIQLKVPLGERNGKTGQE